MTKIPQHLKCLFMPPFRSRFTVVSDSRGYTAATFDFYEAERYIPQGYGRHQYMPNGDALHDQWCRWFFENVPTDVPHDDASKIAAMLNEAWGG